MEHITEVRDNKQTRKVAEAIALFGADVVSFVLMIVDLIDPDGAYTTLQDNGNDDAAECVAFLYFED